MWKNDFSGSISPATVVGQQLFVSLIDQYEVAAFSVSNGDKLWGYTTAGRVDSPPTFHKGKVLFGCTDGWVTCLRATDGELVWRFKAAPGTRRIMDFGRLESVWPVYGSILIQNDLAYFSAGRSTHLDGGIYLYAVEPNTGELRHFRQLQGPETDPESFSDNVEPAQGALPDILLGDEHSIFMRHLKFNPDLSSNDNWIRELHFGYRGQGPRLYTMGGFLDDTYFKRAYWYFGHQANRGRLIVHDDSLFFAVRMFDTLKALDPDIYFTPGKKGYYLYSKYQNTEKPEWGTRVPIRVKAMVLSKEHLYIAGPPDIVDEDDPLGAFEGRKGGRLWVMAADNGHKLSGYQLESPPVFNGMALAQDRLFVSLKEGTLQCLGAE
jgi:hypothetical protein